MVEEQTTTINNLSTSPPSGSDQDDDRYLSPGSNGTQASSETPRLSRASSVSSNNGSVSDVDGIDLLGAQYSNNLPLSDILDTYLTPRIDLAGRRWNRFSGDMRSLARRRKQELVNRARSKKELRQMEEELKKMRKKFSNRIENLQEKWQDAKVVRLRDKISFVVGVLNLVLSSLCFAFRPEWVPTLYSLLALYFLPLRVYSYTRKQWHYFLFDFCYFLNVANLIFIWILPNSKFLFTVCYCAAHGPLAFSVATWRNSLVFHSLEKMTSLFIHLYPPFVFTTLLHFTPRKVSLETFPALNGLERLDGLTAFWFNVSIYLVWQFLYYEFIAIRKKEKILTGQRINSYSTMSKGKGPVANLLGKAPPRSREPAFMLLQFIYTIITTLPAPLILFPSSKASAIFFFGIFTISVWNGASYYVEVFGRRFEKELMELRREMELIRRTESAVSDGLERESAEDSKEKEV
ncbi:hypothetical protein IE53DRAFT_389331 [Violaceomyces palustris]|uniref:Uncharacterized protein n=1 Tax=Violaceomyces palustris TaxID=1673888 RepID=A0ACD0NRL7_9BASI|nr:hypothetical protein IE53DRAFT_389331 [Violaceomyces palustris]